MVLGALQIQAQWGVKGEGDVVRQELDIDKFSGVNLGFKGDIYISQGSPQKVVVEGQQNIIDNIKREVKGDTWRVRFDKNVRNCKPVKIWITIPELTEAAVSGSGNLISETRFTNVDELAVAVSGSGNVKLDVEATSIEGGISGSGHVRLKGSTGGLEMSISGSGNIRSMDLEAAFCEISISGSGDAEVWATQELNASISGSGDIKYKGEAPKVRARVSGSGDISEAR